MSDKISVFTLVNYLKNKLSSDANLQNVLVSGEISNYHRHGSSGHLYFTLKDEKAAIACVMFSSKARTLRFEPKNGDKVLVSASVSIFEVSGQLQLYVNSMRIDGLGDLYQRYEELKNKLAEQGYFSAEHKKRPQFVFPERVAVLVGDKSAALSDIKTQFARRWPLCEIDYYPVLVQGNDAAADIVTKLREADKKDYDLIILARGGGSFEDLFCFNDEELVKTIYDLKTYIVSGVGHEQDYTLCDLVADLRAPTPTAAVELVTPDIKDVYANIERMNELIIDRIEGLVYEWNRQLDMLSTNKYLANPMLLIENKELRLDYYDQRLCNYSRSLENIAYRIDDTLRNMRLILCNNISRKEGELMHNAKLLEAFSLDNTLKRGFSIIFKDGRSVRSLKQIKDNDVLKFKTAEGEGYYRVKEEKHG